MEFETSNLNFFERNVGRLPREAKNAVRKSNRRWAAKLRDIIRMEAPRTGKSARREGPKHDTRHGAIRRSIVSRAGANYAYVRGGNAGTPHFLVHEFGGGVFWTRASSSKSARSMFGHISSTAIASRLGARGVKGHVIPSGVDRFSIASTLGHGKHGAESHFFFGTAEQHIPELQRDAMREALDAMRAVLTKKAA